MPDLMDRGSVVEALAPRCQVPDRADRIASTDEWSYVA